MRQQELEFIVDDTRCFGCAACIALCPTHALILDNLLVLVDQSLCTYCELCIPACPVFALSIENPLLIQS
ncbi:MAG: 4Fe-4S binding protein [Candidatus Thalassarchaeaceae archaeon]|jgi:NAD-dependent dihydropyrimidine dehydrogenase PreA subunit|nr:4Fe-4S binding protein [Candidatus Thalassarchaeaceae archaeon]